MADVVDVVALPRVVLEQGHGRLDEGHVVVVGRAPQEGDDPLDLVAHLEPEPSTSRSRVAPMSGVPMTRWPRRRGGRGPPNTAGARSSTRTVAPGALGTTGAAGDLRVAASATRTTNSTRLAGSTTRQLAVGDRRRRPRRSAAVPSIDVLGPLAAELDPDQPAESLLRPR